MYALKKDPFAVNTSFLARNLFAQTPYESLTQLFSPLIDNIHRCIFIRKLKYKKRNKYYYFRRKPGPMSQVIFDYVDDVISTNGNIVKSKDKEDSLINITTVIILTSW